MVSYLNQDNLRHKSFEINESSNIGTPFMLLFSCLGTKFNFENNLCFAKEAFVNYIF